MFPIINIGPIAIQAVGFILLISFFTGSWLAGKLAENLGTNGPVIENSLLLAFITGILSARIGFMLINPSIFINNPLNLLSLTPSMLDVSFGMLVGILTGLIFAQRKHLPLWPTLDSLTPFFLLIFMGFHLANFASGNAFGLPTELPWGIPLWGTNRHPVQLVAFILGAGLLAGLLIHTRLLKKTGFMHSGVLFLSTLSGFVVITLFTRAFYAEKLLFGPFDFYQLLAFALLLAAISLLYRRVFPKQKKVGVFISIGSNIDPKTQHDKAETLLSEHFRIRRKSSGYLTEDVKHQPGSQPFLNRVIEIETDLAYPELVVQLKSIEKTLGREPGNKVRVALDLDVLTFGQEVFTSADRTIPNPDMLKYRYIAMPLAEISPDFRHPANGLSIQDILEKITDQAQVTKITEVENGINR